MAYPVIPDIPAVGGTTSGTLQNAQGGTSSVTGSAFSVVGMATVAFTIVPANSFGGTVNFKGSADGTNYVALYGTKLGTTTVATSSAAPSAAEIWIAEVAGLTSVEATLTNMGANTGTVTVTAATSAIPNAVPVGSTIGTAVIQANSGTALAADVTNSELRVSAYGKSSAAGDTPIKVASSGDVIVEGAGTAGTASGGVLTVQGVASMTPVLSKVVDSAGTNQVGVNADHTMLVTDGGITVSTVTAQTAGAAALKTSSGRICKIIVTSTATAAIFLYDNTNAASGTVIGAVPASTAIGTMFSPNIPFTNGIFPAGAVNTPSLTVSYI